MSSVMDLAMRNSQALGVVLTNRVVNPAVTLLQGATGYWDVANYTSGLQTLPNRGIGGTALDAQLGSTSSVDSNDPQHLPYSGTPYVYLPGVAGNYLSVPDAAATSQTGDFTIMVRCALATWATGVQTLASKWSSGGQASIAFQTDGAGTIKVVLSADGSASTGYTATASPSISAGTAAWVAVTRDSAAGTIRFFTAPDSASIPSSWTQLGANVAGMTGALRDSTATFDFGGVTAGASSLATGNFYRGVLTSGIGASGVPGGSTVLDVDTSVLTAGSAASFTAVTGQTVTINRSSSGRKAVAVVRPVMLFGTDDYLQVADSDLLDFGATEPMSVLACVRQWATPTSNSAVVAKERFDSYPEAGWQMYNASATSGTKVLVADGTVGPTSNSVAGPAWGATNLMTATRDSGTLRTYNNATASGTAVDTTTGSLANVHAMRIGRSAGTAANYNDFEFLFAAVFRRALSASEISLLATYAASRMP